MRKIFCIIRLSGRYSVRPRSDVTIAACRAAYRPHAMLCRQAVLHALFLGVIKWLEKSSTFQYFPRFWEACLR